MSSDINIFLSDQVKFWKSTPKQMEGTLKTSEEVNFSKIEEVIKIIIISKTFAKDLLFSPKLISTFPILLLFCFKKWLQNAAPKNYSFLSDYDPWNIIKSSLPKTNAYIFPIVVNHDIFLSNLHPQPDVKL